MGRLHILLFSGLLMLPASVVGAAQLVVVDSTAADLKPGTVLDSAKPVQVPAGAIVTVVGDDGKVSTLKGPFSGTVAGSGGGKADPSLVAALSKLVTPGGSGQTPLGAMRGGKPPGSPGPWDIDVLKAGSYCVPAKATPMLWRGEADKAGSATLHLLPGGEKVTVEFAAGAASVAWPKNLPLKDDAQYLAKTSWRTAVAKIAIFLVPDGLPSDAHRVVWMSNQGCGQQARALLATLR